MDLINKLVGRIANSLEQEANNSEYTAETNYSNEEEVEVFDGDLMCDIEENPKEYALLLDSMLSGYSVRMDEGNYGFGTIDVEGGWLSVYLKKNI